MATLTQINVIIADTGSPALTQDDAAEMLGQILQVLASKTLSNAYAATEPKVTITVT